MPITLEEKDLGILREPVQAFVAQAEARGEARGATEERIRMLSEFLARKLAIDFDDLRSKLVKLND